MGCREVTVLSAGGDSMSKTSVKSEHRRYKSKSQKDICEFRKGCGLPCRGCVYWYTCYPEKVPIKPKKSETKPQPPVKKEETEPKSKRHIFTIIEKREIMNADRQKITELAEKYGKPRNYILNLRARWKRQTKE